MRLSNQTLPPTRSLIDTDVLFFVASLLLTLGTFVLPSILPSPTEGRYSIDASDSAAGCLFLPSSIAANQFCDQSILASSMIEKIPMHVQSQAVDGIRESDGKSNLTNDMNSKLSSK